MASVYSEMASVSGDIAEDICKNESITKFVKQVAPDLIGGAVHLVTENEKLADAAKVATSGLAESHGNTVAKGIVAAGACVAISAASVLFVPAVICYGIYSVFKD